LLSHTESLAIATGIANIWARDAVAMASASRTVAEISDGRFILGIGVSHKPVVANRGHTYDKPYSYMKLRETYTRIGMPRHIEMTRTLLEPVCQSIKQICG
jgi:alkanesulfonate monooxygenase SsuD/methylene tetrahydromethanopterin reductase-like flavin-dependent oxidoreductase (luciferase family)